MWWIQFYQDWQRVWMTSESPDKDVARRLLKEHEARVTLEEPLVARSTRVTYDELRTDLKVARVPIMHKPKETAPRVGFFEADVFAAVRGQLPADLQVAVTVAYTFGWRMQSEACRRSAET